MEKIADYVMNSAQLAATLEVSATPKPGNVHRYADYTQTRFEHFLAGAVALGPAVREAAIQGGRVVSGEINYDQIGIGKCLRKAVLDMKSWQCGGNTHLGSIMLFVPLAAAASAIKIREGKIEVDALRKEVTKVIEATTNMDALEFNKAVSHLNLGWLGKIKSKDIPNIGSKQVSVPLKKGGTTFYEIMKKSSEWDGIAYELTNGYCVSFDIGYPTFIETYNKTKDINAATVNAFLKILSKVPDTFIARKIGLNITKNVGEAVKIGMSISRTISEKANDILEKNHGMLTRGGHFEIEIFDRELRQSGGTLNPGTTADLTASSLMIALLTGFRF